MNAIIGFADLLDLDYSPEEKKGFIVTINNNAEQLLRIIDDVLAISRLDSEKMPVDRQSFVPQLLLKDVFNTFEPEAKKQKLKLIVETTTLPEDFTFNGDRIKIRQVLAGFIANALKYTPEGEIRFGAELIENNQLRFYVADTGLVLRHRNRKKFLSVFTAAPMLSNAPFGGAMALDLALPKA